MTTINRATTTEAYQQIAQMANTIWREHYTSIIGNAQVDYMLEKFQSVEAIAEQIEGGYEYYTISYDGKQVGYLSIRQEDDILFLSKIYILKPFRGKKIGQKAMQFIETRAKELECSQLQLTVNKNNTNSILAYERLGFEKVETLVIDIGSGFVMDDFRMEKNLD
ncbi:acetyltransferase (GNAT) family protein [Flavobacteriaceae bacterium MAR_2010_105]|nr:acetyltransferase (GNAT) family protein [Flavobacteriaceae bacterium MAR_2010_105]